MSTTAEAALADSIVSDAETTQIDDRQEDPSNIVYNVVLCFLWNKILKLARLKEPNIHCFREMVLWLRMFLSAEGRDNLRPSIHNVEDILFVLHKHPAELPTLSKKEATLHRHHSSSIRRSRGDWPACCVPSF